MAADSHCEATYVRFFPLLPEDSKRLPPVAGQELASVDLLHRPKHLCWSEDHCAAQGSSRRAPSDDPILTAVLPYLQHVRRSLHVDRVAD